MIDFAITIISLLIGYYLGTRRNPKQDIMYPIGSLEKAAQGLAARLTPSIPTGKIPTPTAKELADRRLPDKVKEGRQAMKEELDKHPELAERRRLIETLKKAGEL